MKIGPRHKEVTLTAAEYYQQPGVRERIREYCGLEGGSAFGCVFIAAKKARCGCAWERAPFYPPGELDRLLDQGLDVSRSLWDTSNLLFHLDIDYLNPDRPAEPIVHPIETFYKLEPVYRAVRHVIEKFKLNILDLMTGEGYHFTGRVPIGDEAFEKLAAIAPGTPSWFASHGTRVSAGTGAFIDERHARASMGLGMVLEHFAQMILRRAALACEIPVVLNATVVGSGLNGRECVSLDLSHITYPLDVRHARAAFSTYQKHLDLEKSSSVHGAGREALIASIPRQGAPLLTSLETSRNPARAARLAPSRAASIPNAADGVSRLVDDYLGSPLAQCHREFYTEGAEEAVDSKEVDQLGRGTVPPCVAACLETPNDLLLRPEYLQNLTRSLLSRDWRPRRIAELIQRLYEGDFGWGDHWRRKHPGWRAEVYVRSFAGMIATGLDGMTDFNCLSTQEKGMCPGGFCGHELAEDRDRLLARGPR